jgi:hypothetical protein
MRLRDRDRYVLLFPGIVQKGLLRHVKGYLKTVLRPFKTVSTKSVSRETERSHAK